MMSNAQIETRAKTICRVYLSLFFIVLFVIIAGLTGLPGVNDRADSAEGMVTAIICFAAYIGLRRRKRWLIPLALAVAAFGILRGVFQILHPARSLEEMGAKLASIFLLLFFWYQIRFFSSKEVKNAFTWKGALLF